VTLELNRLLIGRYMRALEHGDIDELGATVADDLVVRAPDGHVAIEGKEGWLAEQAAGPFTNERITIEDWVVAADAVAVRYSVEAEQTGPFLGVEPTGKTVRTAGVKIYRIRDGLICEIAGNDDFHGLLVQLGHSEPV
jgi:steroid delta-isomerase-like uncharacterized protein